MVEQIPLFELPPTDGSTVVVQKFTPITSPIWTRHKAQLISRYLYYFVQITKHGTYIDGFAGAKRPNHPETWAAKRVLENEPRWLRQFYLFEQDQDRLEELKHLIALQPPSQGRSSDRTVEVRGGDFNGRVYEILTPDHIGENQATFCLLDQDTFECHWATVQALAAHKRSSRKIELFYFFAQGWIGRALSQQKDLSVLEHWWGGDGYTVLRNIRGLDRANIICERMRTELGYSYAYAWPIYSEEGGTRVMYYMIHASDHDEAPQLMNRAYRKIVDPVEAPEQFKMEFEQHFGKGHIDI